MSGPNDNYDPEAGGRAERGVPGRDGGGSAGGVRRGVRAAELKEARLAHAGEKSPIALANREIGALPPAARKDAGQRMGRARGAINAALAAPGRAGGRRTGGARWRPRRST